jgi:ATP-dependent Clp protease ATP-binding subunit ClpC
MNASPRFSEDAQRALARAAEESSRLGHSETWTTDLLVGLLRADESAGGQILKSLGMELDRVLDSVPRAPVGSKEPRRNLPPPPPSPIAQALSAARVQADSLSADQIDTVHLLLGLLEVDQGVAAAILRDQGVDEERVMAAMDRPDGPETHEG